MRDTEPRYARRIGRTVLAVVPELRSTLAGGAWGRTKVAERSVEDDPGERYVSGRGFQQRDVTVSVAPDETFRVVVLGNSGRDTVSLGHGMTFDQARRYCDEYRTSFGLVTKG